MMSLNYREGTIEVTLVVMYNTVNMCLVGKKTKGV